MNSPGKNFSQELVLTAIARPAVVKTSVMIQ